MYGATETEKTRWCIPDRLREIVSKEDIYPLVYLIRFAQRNRLPLDDAKSIIASASRVDEDVAACLENALERIPPYASLNTLGREIDSLDGETVDAYLEKDPIEYDAFTREESTPAGIAKLVLDILDIRPGEQVVDFGSGCGTFLETAFKECPSAKFAGVELKRDAVAFAKIRSFMTGSGILYTRNDMFRFYEKNLAGNPVDKAFSNYPWSVRARSFQGTSAYADSIIDSQGEHGRPLSADWMFNQLLVDSLDDDGLAVGVMSNGACCNGTDRRIREYFIKEGFIKSIIALPGGLYPYTTILSTLVVLCPGGARGIRFVDATDLGKKGRRTVSLENDDIETIIERLHNDSDRSRFLSVKEIASMDYDLSAERATRKDIVIPNGVELADIASVRRGANLRAAELDALNTDEDTGISYLNLGNISDGAIDDKLPSLTGLDPKFEKYLVKDGDLLISKSGAPFKIAVARVPEGRRILANGNLYIVHVDRDKINPYYLAAFLMSPLGRESLDRGTVGTSIPNIPVKNLLGIQVPLEDSNRQKSVADAYVDEIDGIKTLKLRLAGARERISDLFGKTE